MRRALGALPMALAVVLVGGRAEAQPGPPPPGWGQPGPAPGGYAPPQQGGWQPAPTQPAPPPPPPGGYAPPQGGGWGPAPAGPPQGGPPQGGGWGPPPQQGTWGAPPPQWGAPPPPQQQAPRPQDDRRSDGEMAFLYVTGLGYGIGTGVGVDLLANVKEPAVAIIPPVLFGAAVPIGIFFLDREMPFHRGVASSTATGTLLGAGGGLLLSTAHYSLASAGSEWSPGTYSLISILTATGGGIGGYAFGEWLRPDPKVLSFIASGAGWGTLTGGMLGIGASKSGGNSVGGAAAVGGLLGYGAGIVGTGALSAAGYRPSYGSQKWMWLGYGAGVAVTSAVYIAYAFTDGEAKRGLIANAFGGLAGLTLAAIFTFNDTDDESTRGKVFTPPFHLAWQELPGGGGLLTASGMF